MKKKMLALIVTGAMAVSVLLSGCGSAASGTQSGDGASDAEDVASTASDAVIKIGAIWELTGDGQNAGTICSEAVEYAVEYVNENGGINGTMLELVTEDYQTDTTVIVEKTQKLLLEDEVDVLIGPAMLSGIQAMQSTVEANGGLVIYPIPFNGEMDSENIIFTGGTLNTQLTGLVSYLQENYGTKVFIVGSDYSYPVRVSAMTQALVEENGGEVVGDEYLPMGETDCSTVINKIKASGADYVIQSCVGDTTYAFYQQMIDYGLEDVGIGTLITTENEAASMDNILAGTYSGYNWFQCIGNEETEKFIEGFTGKYGEEEASKLNGNAECCYASILLLAEALKTTDDYSAEGIKAALEGVSIDSPQGIFAIDADNYNYADTYSIIVQWDENGTASLVEMSEEPVKSEPYPALLYSNGKEE